MFVFYLLALLPVVVGGVLWVCNKKVVWWEWLMGAGAAVVLAVIFHACTIWGATADEETWSGRVMTATYYPRYRYWYLQAHTTCTPCGKSTCCTTYYTTEYADQPEYWGVLVGYGSMGERHNINHHFYDEICQRFATLPQKLPGHRYNYVSGDPNVYTCNNASGWVQPVTMEVAFTNRLKASPSTFSYGKVPSAIQVYAYPENSTFYGARNIGPAATSFHTLEWDQLNSRLGPKKHVNLIVVGFPHTTPSSYGQWQEAAWIGGKKNDLVIAFAGIEGRKPEWCYVFGWVKDKRVRSEVQAALVDMPINGPEWIAKVEPLVDKYYQQMDWTQFDYITIYPSGWNVAIFLALLCVTQAGVIWISINNEVDKCERYPTTRATMDDWRLSRGRWKTGSGWKYPG